MWLLATRWHRSLSRVFRLGSLAPSLVHPSLHSRPHSRPYPRPCSRHGLLPPVPGARFSSLYHKRQASDLVPGAVDYLQAQSPIYRDYAACGIAVPGLLLCLFPDMAAIRALFLFPLQSRLRLHSSPRSRLRCRPRSRLTSVLSSMPLTVTRTWLPPLYNAREQTPFLASGTAGCPQATLPVCRDDFACGMKVPAAKQDGIADRRRGTSVPSARFGDLLDHISDLCSTRRVLHINRTDFCIRYVCMVITYTWYSRLGINQNCWQSYSWSAGL